MADFYRVQGSKDLFDAQTNQRIADPKMIGTTYTKDLGVRAAPQGSVPIQGSKYPNQTAQQAAFTNIQPIGNTLYGVPKVPSAISTAALVGDNASKLAEAKAKNQQIPTFDENQFQTQLNDFIARYRSSQNAPEIQQAITNRATAATNLASRQDELKNYDLSTQQGIMGLEGQGRGITTGIVRGQQQVLQQQRGFERQGLAAEEANMIDLYNIADQNLKALQDNARNNQLDEMQIFQLQQSAQDSILKQKQYVYEQSQNLSDKQKTILGSMIDMLSGSDPDKLTLDQSNELISLAKSAGIPVNLVRAGLKAKYQEAQVAQSAAQSATSFDQNYKLANLELDRSKFSSDESYREAQLALDYAKLDASSDPSQKPPTADNLKAAGYHDRLIEANSIIAGLEGVGQEIWGMITGKEKFPNILKSSDRQRLEQAERNFINSVLRRESGAVISPSEFENAAKQYFPQPGDSDKTLIQKRANRSTAIANFQREAGSALQNNTAPMEGDWSW